MSSQSAWKYIGVLNECIKILLTVGLGSVLGYIRVFDATTFVPQATKFVFNLSLPCLVIAGLGISIDFYSESMLWSYIGAFLALRAIALFACILLVVPNRSRSVGDIAVYWLCFTWISTGKSRSVFF